MAARRNGPPAAAAQSEVMSEHTSRLLTLNEPALAPLRRVDFASFLVSLPDAKVLVATPPCAGLGITEDETAPMGVKVVAQRVAASGNSAARLERVRLPSAFVPHVFSCATINSPLGRAVLFADPLALIPGASAPAAETSDPSASSPEADEPARPVRFTWEADAQGRLSALSPSIIDALGPRLRAWQGRSFADLTADGVLKDVAAVSDLLLAGASFSDAVLWTAEDPPRRIEIGGVPLFDGAKRRIGVRGFGLIWAAPPRPPQAEPEPPRNVVPLRGGTLSPRERSAFHEIARTLNEAIDGWPKSGGPEAPPPAAPPPEPVNPPAPEIIPPPSVPPAPPPAQMMDEGLLDRLPIGLAVQQRGELVHVNATLLAWAGLADMDAFRASGGLSTRLVREKPDSPLELESVGGGRIPVDVRLVSAPWRGQSAIVHVVRSIDRPAPAPPPPAPVAPPVPQVDVGAERATARAQALDIIPFGVLLLDRAGAIEELNATAAELCGFRGDELQGEPFTLLFASGSQMEAVALLEGASAAAPGDPPGQATLTLRHRLGVETTMEATLVRALHAAPRFCLVLRPPSAAETAARERPAETLVAEDPPHQQPPLAVQMEKEAAAAEAMEPFVRRVSHAVRVPLTGILGFVDAVRSSTFGPVGNSRYAKQAEAAVIAGQQLLASLEDIEQLVPGSFDGDGEAVDVNAVLTEAVEHVAPSARRRRILIRQDVTPELECWFNAPALARMVRMLLEEALRATPAGGQVIVSTRRSDAAGDSAGIVVMIRDGGIGLTEEEIAQALSPLRAATASDRFTAAGLPFRMARIAAVMKANGGELRIRRGVESGMLCEIHLPA
ncbi:PAS domain-containing sensor histidine kinase [Aquabacter sp. CN5-332]